MSRSIIPQFPPEFVNGNIDAIDVSTFGMIALATGSIVNFFNYDGTKITRSFSVYPSASVITVLQFHKRRREILIGDASGRFCIYDICSMKVITSTPPLREPTPICDILWIDNFILTTKGNRFFSCYQLSYGTNVDIYHLWSIQLPILFTRMKYDDINNNFIIFYGHDNSFVVLPIQNLKEIPETDVNILETVSNIRDAQIHQHLPGYVFLVLESSVCLFNAQNNRIVSVIQSSQTTSPFESLIQFRSKHDEVLIRHFNGTLTLYAASDPYNFYAKKYAIHNQIKQRLFMTVKDPIDDDKIIIFYHPFGLAVFDMLKFKILTLCPLFTYRSMCFDTDGTTYANGMSKGLIYVGDMHDYTNVKSYNVGDEDVTFVSVNMPYITWATSSFVGSINTETRKVLTFPQNDKPLQVCGNHKGGLLVLRKPDLLGVYINGKENRISFASPILAFSLQQEESTRDSGSFVVITESRDIYFIKYSPGGVEPPFLQMHVIDQMGSVSSVAWSGNSFVTGSREGILTTFDIRNPSPQIWTPNHGNVSNLVFKEGVLFGMIGQALFVGFGGRMAAGIFTCIVPISSSILAYVAPNGHIRVCDVSSLEIIPDMPHSLPPPPKQTELGTDLQSIISGKPSLRAMSISGAGDSIQANKIYAHLAEKEKAEKWFVVRQLSYASQERDAVNLLKETSSDDPRFMFETALAALLLSDVPPNAVQREFIAQRAKVLFESNRAPDAVTLLTLIGMDKVAVDKLIEMNLSNAAMPMIRGRLSPEDKIKYLNIIAVRKVAEKNFAQASLLFASSGQYHGTLFCLYKLGFIEDATYVMNNIEVKELPEEISSKIEGFIPLDELLKLIKNN